MYYIFSKYPEDKTWHYLGEFKTKEEAENELSQSGEPEEVENMVIKGNLLDWKNGNPIYPVIIID